jgi:hypothetical protein
MKPIAARDTGGLCREKGRPGWRWVMLGAVLAVMTSCTPKSPPAEAASEHAEKKEAEPRVKHGSLGEVLVTVDAETQKHIGLEVAALAPAKVDPEIRTFGQVLDGSLLASLVTDLVAARAASSASQSELDRLKTLSAQNNASERALQAAKATAIRDQAQVEAIQSRLTAGWGPAIAQRADLLEFARDLVALTNVLVRLEMPAGNPVAAPAHKARLFAVGREQTQVEAQYLGPATSVDPRLQTSGCLFLVSPNSSGLAPGAVLTGYLGAGGEPKEGVLVLREAILRHNGSTWIYVQRGEDTFARLEVALETPLANAWFVGHGLKPGEKAVVTGAQQLLSAELNKDESE